MSYPKPLIYFRRPGATLPATLLPSNLDPSSLGIQISSVTTWSIDGNSSMDFAIIGKGPQASPTSAPQTVNVDNVWSIQGCEVRVYLDSRTNPVAFDPDGVTDCPLVFVGDVHEIRPSESTLNPWYAYSCSARGLMSRIERVPVVSPIDNSDSVRFNMNALLDGYQPSTGGKTVGQAIRMILENYSVAKRLDNNGIGGYTLDAVNMTATLDSATIADLNAITVTPPFEFRISGDNLSAAIQQTLDANAPNYSMIVMPNGIIRFPDMRNIQEYNLDLVSNIVDGFNYTKSTLSSYSRVIVRGGPKVTPYYCQWSAARGSQYNLDDSPDNDRFNGTLTEYFDYTGNTNTQAKVAYQHSDYTWGRILLSVGSVSLDDTNGDPLPSNQIRVTPSSGNLPGTSTANLASWIANELLMIDETTSSRRECRIKVTRNYWRIGINGNPDVLLRVDSGEFLITANTVLDVNNTSSVITTSPNVDRLPTYDPQTHYFTLSYELYGFTRPGSVTWRRYKVTFDALPSSSPLNSTQVGMARKIGNIFPTPQIGLAFSNVDVVGMLERKVWYPECLVEYRTRDTNNNWVYQAFWAGFRIDPVNNQIILNRPSVESISGTNGTYVDKTPPWDTGTTSTNQPFAIVPYNIKALLPVYEGTQEAVYPHYDSNGDPAQGESNATIRSIYGIDRDLIISIPDWYDNRDQAYADEYAKEVWDSVEKPLISGSFVWVDGIPSTEWAYTGLRTDGKLQAFRVTVDETCRTNSGSGADDCALVLTSCQIRFSGTRKPYTACGFSTSRPQASIPMHDFHSYEESLARDPFTV